MVLVKLKRFSRSKEQIPEDIQPEPQPDLPTQIQTETQIKKQRGRPKKILKDDIPEQQPQPQPQPQPQDIQQIKEPQEPQPPESINYDDLSTDTFLDDLNNVNYNEVQPEEVPKKVISKKPSLSLDSNKLLEKIKKALSSSSSSPSNFNLDSNLLLQKIKQGHTKPDKPQINNDFDTSMFSKEGSEILGRDKRIILTKIRQYKSLFPDTFKTFKIKANPSIQELQTYLDEMDSIVECDSVEQFLLDSILQSIKLMEGVSTYTKYDIQGLADLLKQNKQFHQLAKQLFIKYKVFSAVPPEFQLLMLVTTTAYICNCKNKRKGELNEYLNQPIISI